MKKVVTHNGSFHADDVFAFAALKLFLGDEELEVVRTRDEEIIKSADWVFDVGSVYNPENLRFDHHQPNGPVRENGIPYAAFGLVWKQIGEKVAGSKEVADRVEEDLVLPIDANDNGVSLYDLNQLSIKPFEVQSIIKKMNPVWGSSEDYDQNFTEAVKIADTILRRSIEHARAKIEMGIMIEEVYEDSDDKGILLFKQPISIRQCVKYPDVKAVIFPDDPSVSSNWIVLAVPEEETGFAVRFKFPAEWGGKRNEELTKVSGVQDAVFCHRNCHLFITKTKDSAIDAAKKYSK